MTLISNFSKPVKLGLVILPFLLAACANTPDRRGPDSKNAEASAKGERGGQQRARSSGTFIRPISLVFADMDRNGDKQLSRTELDTGVEKEWASFDRDPSAIYFSKWSQKTLGSTDASPTFMMFDKDLNGVISKSEFGALFADRFTRYDKDTNGLLDRSELIVAFAAPQGERSRGGQQSGGCEGRRPPR